MLEKYRVGEVENLGALTKYELQGDQDTLYEELKHAVREYFHDNKVALDSRYFLLTAMSGSNTTSAAARPKILGLDVREGSNHSRGVDDQCCCSIFCDTVYSGML